MDNETLLREISRVSQEYPELRIGQMLVSAMQDIMPYNDIFYTPNQKLHDRLQAVFPSANKQAAKE